jgi:HSP20 family protein
MFPEILDTDRLFNEKLILEDNWLPAINVKENKDDFEIEVAAPGFSKKDFEVTITDNVLNIKAENKKEMEEKKDDYSRREFYYNSFERSFTLPNTVNLEKKIKANYENGVLKIHLDKLETKEVDEHMKKIEVL